MSPAIDTPDAVLQRLNKAVFDHALPSKPTTKNVQIPVTAWTQIRELAALAITNTAAASARLDTIFSKIDTISDALQATLSTGNAKPNTYATVTANPRTGGIPSLLGTTPPPATHHPLKRSSFALTKLWRSSTSSVHDKGTS